MVYLALLDLRQAQVVAIVRRSKIDKKSVYEILRDFEARGFVKQLPGKDSAVVYEILSPNRLLQVYQKKRQLAQKKQAAAQTIANDLGTIFKKMNAFDVHYINTAADNQVLLGKIIKNSLPLYCIIDWDAHFVAKDQVDPLALFSQTRKSETYIIAATKQKTLIKPAVSKFPHTYFIQKKDFPIEGALYAIGDTVVVSAKKHPAATHFRTFTVDEPLLAIMVRSLFRLMLFGIGATYKKEIDKDFIRTLK